MEQREFNSKSFKLSETVTPSEVLINRRLIPLLKFMASRKFHLSLSRLQECTHAHVTCVHTFQQCGGVIARERSESALL